MNTRTIIDALDRIFANRETWVIRLEAEGYFFNHENHRRAGNLPEALTAFFKEHQIGGDLIVRRTALNYVFHEGTPQEFDLRRVPPMLACTETPAHQMS